MEKIADLEAQAQNLQRNAAFELGRIQGKIDTLKELEAEAAVEKQKNRGGVDKTPKAPPAPVAVPSLKRKTA